MDKSERRKSDRGNDRRSKRKDDLAPTALLELATNRDESFAESELSIPTFSGEADSVLELTLNTVVETGAKAQEKTPELSPPPANIDAQIFTFMGASGGVGTTSLATDTAFQLARLNKPTAQFVRPQNSQVCLIDLNFESGACSHHLDIRPNMTVQDLCGDASRIDTSYISALVSAHSSGVSLLAAPGEPGATSKINPHAVLAMLDAASKLYRYVIVDLPREHQSWSLPVIGGSDFAGLVFELTIPSIHLAKSQLDRVQTQLGDAGEIEPIISKYERRSMRNALRISDAEKALERPIWATLCLDMESAREAVNCGVPIGQARPDSRLSKDTRKLVDRLVQLRTDAHKNTLGIAAA